MFKFTKKFQTKHFTATFAKPMLVAVALLVVRCLSSCVSTEKNKKEGKGNFLLGWKGKLFTHFELAL